MSAEFNSSEGASGGRVISVIVIPADDEHPIRYEQKPSYVSDLRFWQTLVGGFVEQIKLSEVLDPRQTDEVVMFVNEDGQFHLRDQPNRRASYLAYPYSIVGDAVIVAFDNPGDEQPSMARIHRHFPTINDFITKMHLSFETVSDRYFESDDQH